MWSNMALSLCRVWSTVDDERVVCFHYILACFWGWISYARNGGWLLILPVLVASLPRSSSLCFGPESTYLACSCIYPYLVVSHCMFISFLVSVSSLNRLCTSIQNTEATLSTVFLHETIPHEDLVQTQYVLWAH